MKTKTTYICEICGAQYDTEMGAAGCETHHAVPVSFGDCNYNHGCTDQSKYPTSVHVRFDDGGQLLYHR